MSLSPRQFGKVTTNPLPEHLRPNPAGKALDQHRLDSWHADGSYLTRLHAALENSPSRKARGGGPDVR